MRKQYYFRPSAHRLLAWDVGRLIELSANFTSTHVRITDLGELDRKWSGDDEQPTWRGLIDHIRLIEAADLSFPIILPANREVMDGRHRIAKAVLAGRETIECVQFENDPPPDHIGKQPEELPY